MLRKLVVWKNFGRDIAVVILGVLIALAFNSWAQARSDRRLERSYLSRIARDLRADSALLKLFEANAARGQAGAETLLRLLHNRNEVAADTVIARCFSDATRGALSSANTPTIEELKSTGNLRVLRDVKLRDALMTYYSEIGRIQRVLETVMRRGREPLAEVGWDIRAFDPTLSYAVARPAPGEREGFIPDGQAGALLRRLRAHPDAERAAYRAATYQRSLGLIITSDWARQLKIVRSAIYH